MLAKCVSQRPTAARYRSDAFPGCQPWQDVAVVRSRASIRGSFSPHAFPKGPQAGKASVRGNISPACIQIQLILARYACYASEKPRKAPLGNTPREHLAAKGRFAVRSPQIMHGARILPPSDGLVPAQGLLPEQPHRETVFQRLGPCAGVPAPAPRRYPPPANACRSPCPLQSGTSRRRASAATIRRMACSPAKPRGAAGYVISTGGPTTECCAGLGLDSRTVDKWAQNRRRRPQAGPGLRQRCRKRPSKGRVPLGGTIGTPPK